MHGLRINRTSLSYIYNTPLQVWNFMSWRRPCPYHMSQNVVYIRDKMCRKHGFPQLIFEPWIKRTRLDKKYLVIFQNKIDKKLCLMFCLPNSDVHSFFSWYHVHIPSLITFLYHFTSQMVNILFLTSAIVPPSEWHAIKEKCLLEAIFLF